MHFIQIMHFVRRQTKKPPATEPEAMAGNGEGGAYTPVLSRPQTSNWVRAGKGEGSSAWISWPSRIQVIPLRAMDRRWGS